MEENKEKSDDSSNHYGSIRYEEVKNVERVVDDALDLLLEVLKQSTEYKEYQRCLAEVKKDEQLWQSLSEFQRQHFVLHATPDDNVAEKERILCRDHETLLALPTVREFQQAEKEYCKVVRSIQDRFAKQVEIDISFLEE